MDLSTGNSLVVVDRSSSRSSSVTSFCHDDLFDPKSEKSLLFVPKQSNHHRYFYWTLLLLVIVFSTIAIFILSITHFVPQTWTLCKDTKMTKTESHVAYVVKEGLRYGNGALDQNFSFNDAYDQQLSYTTRCVGVYLAWSNDGLTAIQFIYDERTDFSNMIDNDSSTVFMLGSQEEIIKINVYEDPARENFSIVGIQFFTNHHRKSPLFGSSEGILRAESFETYVFASGQGRQDPNRGIDLLQFIWIKQDTEQKQIRAVGYPLMEICEFTYISKIDFALVHCKGKETSWHELKSKFQRQGEACHPRASYYEKTSARGPQLFALLANGTVFYHDNDIWYPYRTANNTRCYLTSQSSFYA